jgi:DNA polymerase elongation subunit (family B)
MRGWIFDVYPDYKKNVMVLWLKTKSGVKKIEDGSFRPSFYVYHPSYEELRTLARDLMILDHVSETKMVKKKIDIRSRRAEKVLKIRPRNYSDMKKCARIVDSRGGYYEYKLYNVDIRLSQRYLAERKLFPMAMVNVSKGKFELEDGQFRLRYAVPNLTGVNLNIYTDARIPTFHDPLTKIELDDAVLEGSEDDILLGLVETLKKMDPDVIYTKNGDGFVLPYLFARAKMRGMENDLVLGREHEGQKSKKKGKSYFSYGSILYKPPAHTLKGRLHIDSKSSFMFGEGGLSGLIDLSRLSCIPVQALSRLSPGSAISAMQVNCALEDGYVVLWKKNIPEDFKTAEELIVADRGGLIFEPVVGVHEGIVEVDFTSLYPNIMANYNLSPETMMCDCCPESKRMVPELLYHVCEKRIGLIPRVVKPLVQRRIAFKKLVKAQPKRSGMYKQKADVLKWLLVTCLDGKTVVPYEKEGEVKFQSISEIVDKYLPEDEGTMEVNNEFHVFGLKKDMKPTKVPVKKVFKFHSPEKILRLRIRQGRDLWVTKDHPCYVLEEGELKVKRADELKEGEYLPFVSEIKHEVKNKSILNLAEVLEKNLPPKELPLWRAFGKDLPRAISHNYDSIRTSAVEKYTEKSIWNWREYGYLPFQFLSHLKEDERNSSVQTIGRGRRGGGEIQRIPAQIDIDFDLGFFLGYFVGDGNAKNNMVRFAINSEDKDIVEMLNRIIKEKFGLSSKSRKENHANMYVLQANSIALKRILEVALDVPCSAKNGKLEIPPIVLNGTTEIKYGFISGLIASDGSVSQKRNFVNIASHDYAFVKKIGLLLSMLGLEYRLVFGKRLHEIQFRNLHQLEKLYKNCWFKTKHRKRIEKKLNMNSTQREQQIPVRESGLLHLTKEARVTREPRVTDRVLISRENALSKLGQLFNKKAQFDQNELFSLERLNILLHSGLTFSQVVSIEEVPPRTPYVYCFEVDGGLPGFVVEGNIFTHNCFGYTGYKNARFGRIECHESINAYGRDILVRTMEIAEQYGYEVLHGIVDCLWLKPNGYKDHESFCDHISREIDIPLDLEGIYKWLVFLPNKTTGVGALNRYYGLFSDDTLKIRGIDLRKRDTPKLMKDAQAEMLEALSKANNSEEFIERLPECIGILKRYHDKIRDGECALEDLVITKRISRNLDEYSVENDQVAALKQLKSLGFGVNPGEKIRFIICDSSTKEPTKRVKVAELIEGDEKYDAGKYIELLLRSGAGMLVPFGYDEEELRTLML